MIKKISLLFVVFFLVFGVVAKGAEPQNKELEDQKKRLLQIQEQINEEKKKEEKARATEKKEKQALGVVNKNLEKTKGELDKYKKEITYTKKNLQITELNLKQKERALGDYRDLLSARISAFYRNIFFPSQISTSSKLIGFYNNKDLGKKLKVFTTFAKENANLIQETEFQKKTIEGKKQSLKVKESQLTSVKVVKEKKKQELESQKKEKEKSISKAEAERKKSIKKQEELRKSARELEAMIKNLTAKKGVSPEALKKEAMIFERDKDRLPWPVSKGRVVSYFGWSSSSYGTSIFNPGIDIEVSGSENVYAVSKGKVLFNGPFRSYGKTVIIDHGGGYCSVYSGLNQSSVTVSQEIKSGQAIGSVSSNLHFEMRKDAKTIDPLEWLKNK